jgi:hypothetical protein
MIAIRSRRFPVASGTDKKIVQELLRHSKVQTTPDLYSQSMPIERMVAPRNHAHGDFEPQSSSRKPITGASRV